MTFPSISRISKCSGPPSPDFADGHPLIIQVAPSFPDIVSEQNRPTGRLGSIQIGEQNRRIILSHRAKRNVRWSRIIPVRKSNLFAAERAKPPLLAHLEISMPNDKRIRVERCIVRTRSPAYPCCRRASPSECRTCRASPATGLQSVCVRGILGGGCL